MTIDIPMIDLTPFRTGTAAGKASVAWAVAAGLETLAFWSSGATASIPPRTPICMPARWLFSICQ